MSSILRVFTAGHVDDGKSTLIGRLLYDSRSLFEDHLTTLKKDSAKKYLGPFGIDYSLVTDGLKAEREQGITIDVAYRYFSTPKRKIILADTPGHEQYTRNMATAASNSDVLLLLVDAQNGITTQTKRHLTISALMGIQHVVIAINKMDLVGYSDEPFSLIAKSLSDLLKQVKIPTFTFIPISALHGDHIVEKSDKMSWFQGPTLLHYLESIPSAEAKSSENFRLPIQTILRGEKKRFYAGTISSGSIKKNGEMRLIPSQQFTRARSILSSEREVDEAFAGQAVAIELENEMDVSRGNMFVSVERPPEILNQCEAQIIWMNSTPAERTPTIYLLSHTSQVVSAKITRILSKFNPETMLPTNDCNQLTMNEIASVSLELHRPIFADPYQSNRSTGSFLLLDPRTNQTVAAGLISNTKNLFPTKSSISSEERRLAMKQIGRVIWFTGLSGSGKSTLANALEKRLFGLGKIAYVLEGDRLRNTLCSDLGFSPEDRAENIRRAGEVASLFCDAGMIVLAAFISPLAADRERARMATPKGQFCEVYLQTPLSVCEMRDPKGLYKRARGGEIKNFTGISSPYEPPHSPELTLDTSILSVDECIEQILPFLDERA